MIVNEALTPCPLPLAGEGELVNIYFKVGP